MDVNSVTLKAPKRSDAPVREGDLGENTSRSLRDLCLVVGGLFVAQVIMWLIHDAMPIGRVFYVSVLLFCLSYADVLIEADEIPVADAISRLVFRDIRNA